MSTPFLSCLSSSFWERKNTKWNIRWWNSFTSRIFSGRWDILSGWFPSHVCQRVNPFFPQQLLYVNSFLVLLVLILLGEKKYKMKYQMVRFILIWGSLHWVVTENDWLSSNTTTLQWSMNGYLCLHQESLVVQEVSGLVPIPCMSVCHSLLSLVAPLCQLLSYLACLHPFGREK